MIKLPPRPECPLELRKPKVRNQQRLLEDKVNRGESLSSEDFKGRNYWTKVKKQLSEYQNGKCAFCERRKDANAETDVEHYRPKLEAAENENVDHIGYWWLAYEWSNLLFSCKACNEDFKDTHFPLLEEASRATGPDSDISAETPMLINPCLDDPADFIEYEWESTPEKVFLIGKDAEGRGRKTIEIFQFNVREELHKGRYEIFETLGFVKCILERSSPQEPIYKKAIGLLKRKIETHQEYLGFVRYYIHHSKLQEFIA